MILFTNFLDNRNVKVIYEIMIGTYLETTRAMSNLSAVKSLNFNLNGK